MRNISRFRNILKIVDCNEMRKLLKYHCSAKLQLCPFNWGYLCFTLISSSIEIFSGKLIFNQFSTCTPPESIRKPEVFLCFQGVWIWTFDENGLIKSAAFPTILFFRTIVLTSLKDIFTSYTQYFLSHPYIDNHLYINWPIHMRLLTH